MEQVKYIVFVDDNFHYMNEDERYTEGSYATIEEALSVCRRIVDEFLENAYKPKMTENELFESYTSFGDDPWISGHTFSARDYAKACCK